MLLLNKALGMMEAQANRDGDKDNQARVALLGIQAFKVHMKVFP